MHCRVVPYTDITLRAPPTLLFRSFSEGKRRNELRRNDRGVWTRTGSKRFHTTQGLEHCLMREERVKVFFLSEFTILSRQFVTFGTWNDNSYQPTLRM